MKFQEVSGSSNRLENFLEVLRKVYKVLQTFRNFPNACKDSRNFERVIESSRKL